MALRLQGAELAALMANTSVPATGAARVPGIGLEGLPNIGDSCYMSAVLLPLFGRVETFEPLDPEVRAAFCAVRAAVGRDARIEALRGLRDTFAGAEQEDAADFARFLATRSPLFESSVESTFRCSACDQVTTTTRESAWTLKIHPAGGRDTLLECLRRISRTRPEEVLFGPEHPCSGCKSLRRTSTDSIPSVGAYLFIEIVRDLGRAVEEVSFRVPAILRDSNAFPLAPPAAAHELLAVVYYVTGGGPLVTGGASCGHYVVAVLAANGTWYLFDDEALPQPIDPAQLARGHVRLLLYGPRAEPPTAGLSESVRHGDDSCTGAAGAPARRSSRSRWSRGSWSSSRASGSAPTLRRSGTVLRPPNGKACKRSLSRAGTRRLSSVRASLAQYGLQYGSFSGARSRRRKRKRPMAAEARTRTPRPI